jgi:hypothetical protein
MENYTKSSQKKGWKTTQSRVRRKNGKLHKVESLFVQNIQDCQSD